MGPGRKEVLGTEGHATGERSPKSVSTSPGPRPPLARHVFSGRVGMVWAGPELKPDPTRPRFGAPVWGLVDPIQFKGAFKGALVAVNRPALVSELKVLGDGSDPQGRTQGLARPSGPPATWPPRREATGTLSFGE